MSKEQLLNMPKLFPLPYYSISQAAEQIDVSEDYIEAAITCGLVRPCVLLDSHEPVFAPSYLIGCKEVLSNIQIDANPIIGSYTIENDEDAQTNMSESVVGVNPLSKLDTSNIDEYISSNSSQANVTGFTEDESGLVEVEAYLHGFWQLANHEEAVSLLERSSDEEFLTKVFPYVDECWYQQLGNEPGAVRVLGFDIQVTKKQLVISHLDTVRLLEAYHSKAPMKDMGLYGETQPNPITDRKQRKSSDQSLAMICGLIASHPGLGEKYLDQPSELYRMLEQMFANQGISLNSYFPTLRSFSRWLQGEYRASLSLKDKS
ncbi:hypothetical protein OPW41_14300 [Vibrio europaeus]|uniref:Uncharacterized protein n=1 Tax=Vibrio europaeus TaxID=300876 RepID=A0ABT5GTY9_9VIBR|nr:hypothetical protein [Vibrio europaeus]MDC5703451.1 hypothetical protein [Vibrio europaeus]MDC5711394.1 hypothetical protein [Vibrio europaeus]MDC5714887.1 hypothetical protein [Vibrio europaeus]MDC5727505.1 hypothetical protein [Vibrio europaeus]MDC5729718.1 hypothetical protein [Vibrio europaeus]